MGGSDLAPPLADLADPHSDLSCRWDADHDMHVLHRLLDMVRPDFASATWTAFRRTAMDGFGGRAGGGRTRLTVNAVRFAESRLLWQLHAELAALTGDSRLS